MVIHHAELAYIQSSLSLSANMGERRKTTRTHGPPSGYPSDDKAKLRQEATCRGYRRPNASICPTLYRPSRLPFFRSQDQHRANKGLECHSSTECLFLSTATEAEVLSNLNNLDQTDNSLFLSRYRATLHDELKDNLNLSRNVVLQSSSVTFGRLKDADYT